MKKFIILLFLLVLYNTSYGQSIKWQRVYKGILTPGQDFEGYDILLSDYGNFFILGNYSKTSGRCLLKINAFGDTIFNKFYQGGMGITGLSLNNGGIVTTGEWLNSPSYLFTAQYNSDGSNTDFKFYNSLPLAQCLSIKKTTDNNYIGCGKIVDSALIFKLDSSFNLIWHKTYPANWYKIYYSITEANNGDYIAVGVHGYAYGSTYGLFSRFDTSGNIVWEKNYLLFNYGFQPKSINNITGNRYLISVTSYDTVNNKSASGFIKIDDAGDILFKKIYMNFSNYYYRNYDSKVINNNKYIFCSFKYGESDSSLSSVMITDSLGNILKRQEYSGTTYTLLYKITVINENDFLFIGASDHLSNNDGCVYAIRTDTTLTAPPPPIGINNNSSIVPNNFVLFQNYPNPFNPNTNIRFCISENGKLKIENGTITIKIYNILGKEVTTLINEKLKPGIYEVKFDGNNFPSGTYFYKIQTGNFVQVKRMVLLK